MQWRGKLASSDHLSAMTTKTKVKKKQGFFFMMESKPKNK
jgi:hypothetical protein